MKSFILLCLLISVKVQAQTDFSSEVKRGIDLLYSEQKNATGCTEGLDCADSASKELLIKNALEFKNQFDQTLQNYKLTGFSTEKVNFNLTKFKFDSPIQKTDSLSNTVHGYIYRPSLPYHCEGNFKFPGTLFIHHVADKIDDEQMFANLAAKMHKGVIMLIYLPEYGPRKKIKTDLPFANDIYEFKKQLLQSILDIHIAGEILKADPMVAENSLQLAGLSLGAMVTAISAGIDPLFNRYMIGLGGGDLASIMTSDKSKHGGEIKSALSNISWNTDYARYHLSSLDALTWAYTVKNKKIMILNAQNDELIDHEKSFIKLLNAYKQNNQVETKIYDSTHVPDHHSLGLKKALGIYVSILSSIVNFFGDSQSAQINQCQNQNSY